MSIGRSLQREQDLIWVETPFGAPEPRIVVAAARAGAFGVLDLGADRAGADAARRGHPAHRSPLRRAGRRPPCRWAPRPAAHGAHRRGGRARTRASVLGARGRGDPPARGRGPLRGRGPRRRRRGRRPGGQGRRERRAGRHHRRVRARPAGRALGDRPVWVQGGIGRHTAAAAVVGGATGVVLDAQAGAGPRVDLPARSASPWRRHGRQRDRVVAGPPRLHPARPAGGRPRRPHRPDQIAAAPRRPRLRDQALPAGQDAPPPLAGSPPATAPSAPWSPACAGHRRPRRRARRVEPLAPGRGVAATTGTRYPVVQGPMTRVTDRAAFAGQADGGGLPFLALALLRGDRGPAAAGGDGGPARRPALGRRRARLRPAGAARRAAGRDPRRAPPLALIAGGRPSQAAALEEAGIRTFLHVPVARLLDAFLARTAPAASCSRASSAAATSGRGRASPCGRRQLERARAAAATAATPPS